MKLADKATIECAVECFLPLIGSAACPTLFERLRTIHRCLRTTNVALSCCFLLAREAPRLRPSPRLNQMKLADNAIRKPPPSLLGSADAQRSFEQLRAPRLAPELLCGAPNGTVPRIQPCDELSRAAAPASDETR